MEKYYLTNDKAFETVEEMADYITDNAEAYDEYDEYLDCDGAVDVAGLSFYPSTILKECDPIAYNCGYNDFMDFVRDEIITTLENMDDGETETIYGIEIEAHEYHDDEE